MIDDGNYALSIVGYRDIENEGVELLFADPHIKSNKEHNEVGFYGICFTSEGEPKGETRNEHQIKESSHNVFQQLTFKEKAWMICYLKQ